MSWVEAVCAEARTWESTPYVPNARVKGVGVDCGGILYECYNPHFGPLPLPPHAAPDWAVHGNADLYMDFIRPFTIQVPMPRAGGFTLYHMGNFYAHAAILLDTNEYIHAWGRLREGRVTRTAPRVMNFIGTKAGFPPRHFYPIEK